MSNTNITYAQSSRLHILLGGSNQISNPENNTNNTSSAAGLTNLQHPKLSVTTGAGQNNHTNQPMGNFSNFGTSSHPGIAPGIGPGSGPATLSSDTGYSLGAKVIESAITVASGCPYNPQSAISIVQASANCLVSPEHTRSYAVCPNDTVLTGGGSMNDRELQVDLSSPAKVPTSNAWVVDVSNPTLKNYDFAAYAICLSLKPYPVPEAISK